MFNTNNLWISTRAIKRLLGERALELEVIVNPKQVVCSLYHLLAVD